MTVPPDELQAEGIDPESDLWDLSDRQFRRLIALCARHGAIRYTNHAQERALQRKISLEEVVNCLKMGTQYGDCSADEKGRRVMNLHRLAAGEQLRVTVRVTTSVGPALVITVAWI